MVKTHANYKQIRNIFPNFPYCHLLYYLHLGYFPGFIFLLEVTEQSKRNALSCSDQQFYVSVLFLICDAAVFGIRECPQRLRQI